MFRALLLAAIVPMLIRTLSATEPFIWVEGEKPDKKQVIANAGLNAVNPDELSGGGWISSFANKGQPTGFAEYNVDVPQAGKYRLWVRAGGNGLAFSVDRAEPPVAVDMKNKMISRDFSAPGLDPVSIAANGNPHYPPQACWFDLGTLDLTAGQHVFTWYLGGLTGEGRFAGMDCFVLTTGEFKPNGKYKPTEAAPASQPGFQPGQAWNFIPPVDTFDPAAVLDLSLLNEKEAGEHGFIKTDPKGNGFVRGDGQPIRFWSVDLSSQRPRQTVEAMKKSARFLAKRGVNMVRLFIGVYVTKEGAKITDIDEAELDEIFKMVAAFKSAGIYTMTSPLWITALTVPKSWGIPGVAGPHSADGLLFFEPTVQQGYKAWMKAMYTRPNPHTGLTLAADPAVAILQIQNEDSLLWWGANNIKGEQLASLRRMYADFLKKKYGSLDKAKEAWQGYQELATDDWDKGLPGLQNMWLLSHDARTEKSKIPGYEARTTDQTEFLARVMYDFNQDMARYFHEDLGCKQLINAGNWRTSDPLFTQDAEYWSYSACDIMARNIYVPSYHAGIQGWNLKPTDVYIDLSMTRDPVGLPTNLKQPVGRPYMIPETLWPEPNLYKAEGPLMIATQMALNGMSGVAWCTSALNFWGGSVTYKWDVNTPVGLAQFPAAALIYRAGLVKEGEPAVVEHRTIPDLWQRTTPIISEESGWDPNRDTDNITRTSSVKTAADPLAYLVGPVRVVYDSDPAKTTVIDLAKYIDREKKIVKSDTGQIECEYGKGLYLVNAPAAQAAAGFLKEAGPQQLADVTIDCKNKYAVIVVVSLDNKPIKESSKVLVQVGTTCRPTGWSAYPTRVRPSFPPGAKQTDAWRIISPGQAPRQVENTEATITVSNPALTKAILLDINGMPTDTPVEATVAGGKITAKLPPNTIYVVLTAGDNRTAP